MPNDLSSPVLDLPAATTAVLHGMMATLSEVLGGIDGRIAALEHQVREGRAESGSPRALAQTVEAAVARLSERVEALESAVVAAALPARDEALHGALADLAARIDGLAQRPVADAQLHAAVSDLAVRVEGLVQRPVADAQLHAAVSDLAVRVDGLAQRPVADEGLHAAVSDLAVRIEGLVQRPVADEQLHAAVADMGARLDELARRPLVDEPLREAVSDLTARTDAIHGVLAERPVRDEQLHAALADVAARVDHLAQRPVVDEALHLAVADLAARPVRDDDLHAAVADLMARTDAVQATLVEQAVHDEGVRTAIAALAQRPVRDDELHAAVAALAERPVTDEALHAAVAALAERPVTDEALHAAVADLAARTDAVHGVLAERPVRDDDLHAAIADLAQRPTRDDDLHAAVAALAERVARPGPDDPIRAGVASLHERLNVLLDIVAQPPQPDDAVREGLVALEQRVGQLATELTEALNEPDPEPAPTGPDPLLVDLSERLRQWQERAAAADEEASTSLRLALSRLGEITEALDADDELDQRLGRVADDLAALRDALVDHPAATLTQAIERVEQQVAAFVSQPGPGPAMAMVAAGLAERFEARTDGVVELLTGLARDLDGLTHTAEGVPEAIAAVTAKLEETAAAIAAVPEAVGAKVDAATAGLPEAVGARVDAATAGLPEAMAALPDAVAAAASEAAASATAGLPEQIGARLAGLPDPAELARRVEEFVGGQFAELARREEAVAQALAAVQQTAERSAVDPAVLERIRSVMDSHQGDMAAVREALRTLFDSVDRHAMVSSQVAELLLENRAVVSREVDRLQAAVASQGDDAAERVRAAVDAVAQTQAGISAIVADAMEAVRADVQALAATGQDPAQLHAVADRISESVHRESELLTQRVAALSVAVESLRSLVENSPGRKASEVGRRLAADLGIRTKAPAAKGKSGKGPKSLGPGE